LVIGTHLRPLIASKAFANTGARVYRIEAKYFTKKKAPCFFFNMKLVSLAKLREFEVDFARNPGTVPAAQRRLCT
jgi:hypothetical protein